MHLDTVPIADPVDIKGILFPRGVTYNQIVVTGPPGSGKSDMVRRLRGWPQEGFVDLKQNGWWHARILAYRPCQVHLGIPLVGLDEVRPVTDPAWLASAGRVDASRIVLPTARRSPFTPNWRRRLVFLFQLPSPDDVYAARSQRARYGTHPVDQEVTREQVERQHNAYGEAARCLASGGFQVLVRETFDGPLRLLNAGLNALPQRPVSGRIVGAIWTRLR